MAVRGEILKKIAPLIEEQIRFENKLKSKDKALERKRKYSAARKIAFPEKVKAEQGKFRKNNREKINSRAIELHKRNPKNNCEKSAKYRNRNLKKIRLKQKEHWRAKHPNGPGRGRWRKPEPVINDKGEEFDSTQAAGKFYHISPESIMYACRDLNRKSCGIRWRYKKDGVPTDWNFVAMKFTTSNNLI